VPRQASPAASRRSCRTLCLTFVAMDSLELKVPPPAVALLLGLLMWLASALVAPVEVPFGPRVAVALVLASVGLFWSCPRISGHGLFAM